MFDFCRHILLKRGVIEMFADAKFDLHKWHSNVPDLEVSSEDDEPTFAKQSLGNAPSDGKTKLLGLPWDKVQDTLSVVLPMEPAELTKRGILANLAQVYEPIGLVSPVRLNGKCIYREACDHKIAWDAPLPTAIGTKWRNWEQKLPNTVSLPRCLTIHQEPIKEVKLHAFGDASGYGVSAMIYAVVNQESGVTQGLVASKSRLSKQGFIQGFG